MLRRQKKPVIFWERRRPQGITPPRFLGICGVPFFCFEFWLLLSSLPKPTDTCRRARCYLTRRACGLRRYCVTSTEASDLNGLVRAAKENRYG